MNSGHSDLAAVRITRAMNIGVVVLVSLVHFVYDTSKLLLHWQSYDSTSAAAGAWCALALINIVGAVLLLRRRSGSPWIARALAVVALTIGAIATAASPAGEAIGDSNWAWNAVGWFGVLLLIRRPLWELALLLTGNVLLTATFLAFEGGFDESLTTRFIVVIYTTVGVQALVVVTNKLMHRVARQAIDNAMAESQAVTRERSADAIFAGRQERYAYLRTQAEPLLRALAEGTADPADEAFQRSCAIEAGKLRRLFAETDDTANPLLHELLACVDIAERRDVEVDLVVLGDIPSVPTLIRRKLTDGPLAVLAAAVSSARLTVVANHDEIVVSIIADVTAEVSILPSDLPSDSPAFSTVSHREGANQWVETRWTAVSTLALSTTTPSSSKESTPG